MTHKRSKQREAIIRVLKGTKSHPSADWIYEHVKQEIPDIGVATVYRNLRILKESGDIVELCLPGETARFDGKTCKHYHFRCDRCGNIMDLDEPVDTEIEARIAHKTGLKVTYHHLLFCGLCPNCQKLEIQSGSQY